MGLLKKSLKNAAQNFAESITEKATEGLEAVMNRVDKDSKIRFQRFLDKYPSHADLFVECPQPGNEIAYARNAQKEAKYRIVLAKQMRRRVITVTDLQTKQVVGTVRESVPVLKDMISSEDRIRNYEIEINGEILGTVNASGTSPRKVELAFNEWSLSGNEAVTEYQVLDETGDPLLFASQNAYGGFPFPESQNAQGGKSPLSANQNAYGDEDLERGYLLAAASPAKLLISLMTSLAVAMAADVITE